MNYCSVALFPFSEVGECLDKAVFVQNIKKYCAAKGVKPTVACRESGVGSSFINNKFLPSRRFSFLLSILVLPLANFSGKILQKVQTARRGLTSFSALTSSLQSLRKMSWPSWNTGGYKTRKRRPTRSLKPHKILKISPSAGNSTYSSRPEKRKRSVGYGFH